MKAEAYVDEQSNLARWHDLNALEKRLETDKIFQQNILEYREQNFKIEMQEKELERNEAFARKRESLLEWVKKSEKKQYDFYRNFTGFKQETEELKDENEYEEERKEKLDKSIREYQDYEEQLEYKLRQLKSEIAASKAIQAEKKKGKSKKKK